MPRTKLPLVHGTNHGYDTHKCRCTECTRAKTEYSRQSRSLHPEASRKAAQTKRLKRRELIRQAKDKPCFDCGNKYPYYIMQFDHIQDKRTALGHSKAISLSLASVIAEIEKCEVVCANCHAERTHQRRPVCDTK